MRYYMATVLWLQASKRRRKNSTPTEKRLSGMIWKRMLVVGVLCHKLQTTVLISIQQKAMRRKVNGTSQSIQIMFHFVSFQAPCD